MLSLDDDDDDDAVAVAAVVVITGGSMNIIIIIIVIPTTETNNNVTTDIPTVTISMKKTTTRNGTSTSRFWYSFLPGIQFTCFVSTIRVGTGITGRCTWLSRCTTCFCITSTTTVCMVVVGGVLFLFVSFLFFLCFYYFSSLGDDHLISTPPQFIDHHSFLLTRYLLWLGVFEVISNWLIGECRTARVVRSGSHKLQFRPCAVYIELSDNRTMRIRQGEFLGGSPVLIPLTSKPAALPLVIWRSIHVKGIVTIRTLLVHFRPGPPNGYRHPIPYFGDVTKEIILGGWTPTPEWIGDIPSIYNTVPCPVSTIVLIFQSWHFVGTVGTEGIHGTNQIIHQNGIK